MDSALSVWFLLLWLGGDSCNLIGSFLADQLPLQVMRELVLKPQCNALFFFFYYYFLCLLQLCVFFFFHLRQSLYMHASNSENIFNYTFFLFHLDIHSHILRTCWLGDDKFVFLLQVKAQGGWKWVSLVSCLFLSFKFQPPNTAPYSCFPLWHINSFMGCCQACNPFTL